MEYAVTLLAATIAIAIKRDGLTVALCLHWLATSLASLLFDRSLLPGISSIIDLVLCHYAMFYWAAHHDKRARCMIAITFASVLVHFGFSVNFGNADWKFYAITSNALFVLNCIIAGGRFNGLVNIIDTIGSFRYSRHAVDNRGRQ
jgi:hypothetical protein